jgi:SAM-dependent methyltransferase
VVALPDPLAVGTTISRRAWPAHVTLASNFVIDGGRDEVTRAVAVACADEPPLRLRFADQAWFGPRQDISVQLVDAPQITALHERLADALESSPGFAAETPEHWRDGYRPHMTHVLGVATPAGTRARLPHIAVAAMAGGSATVVAAIVLGRDAGGTGRQPEHTVVDPMHFDRMAGAYASARPPYPAELWQDVRADGRLVAGIRVLELGAGSGEATRELVAAGAEVVAVEPGANLAAILHESLPAVTVVRSRAEDLRVDDGAFDLAVAATSIHWMNLGIVLPILHRALARDGRLLVWRNVFGDADADTTAFRQAVHRIVQCRGSTRAGNAEDADATAQRLADSGLFAVERIHRYRWSVELDADRIHALFSTFSEWAPSEVDEAAAAVDELGGTVTEHYASWLITARPERSEPRADPPPAA